MNDRWLADRLRFLKIKQVDFCNFMNIRPQHFKRLELEKPKQSPNNFEKMAEILKCEKLKLMLFWDDKITSQELFDRSMPAELQNITIPANPNSIKIEMLDVTACCGNGVETPGEKAVGEWIMPLQDFHQITFSAPKNIKMLKVVGDSMFPTLKSGDWVLADISQNNADIDGLYLIRMASGLAIKRLQIGLNDIQVVSDNSKYRPLTAAVGEINVIGRVIYTLNAEKVG